MKSQLALATALILIASPMSAQDGSGSETSESSASESSGSSASSGDGGLAFNNHCRKCHSRDEGDNRLGPNLHEIVGREAGGAENFAYSSAFQQADFTWDETRLDEYIANPDKVVPGNNMQPYSGIGDAEIRKNIIKGLGGDASKI